MIILYKHRIIHCKFNKKIFNFNGYMDYSVRFVNTLNL